jgi:calcineurin-like phosphoesterase family protein
MNEALVTNWNNKVGNQDTVYMVGDISFGKEDETKEVLTRLNGRKVLILGNHDKVIHKWKNIERILYSIHDMLEIDVIDSDCPSGKQRIVLLHYAMRVWNKSHFGAWHLYGHSHGTLPDDPNSLSLDVGVDCHKYAPISYEEVKGIMRNKTFKPVDQHGSREFDISQIS